MVLCSNPRFDNNEALVEWELIALDVRAGSISSETSRELLKLYYWVAAVEGLR